jgi:transposase-like protein
MIRAFAEDIIIVVVSPSVMPQLQLPLFPEGVTHINAELAFVKENDRITYFNGTMPVFVHDVDDHRTFKMITAQFCVTGNTKLVEISRAFGVPEISVKRAVKLYREEGPKGFYKKRKTRGPAVLTEAVLCQAQQLFDEGLEVSEVADQIGVKSNTLSKAVRAGRVHKRTQQQETAGSSKSERSAEDSRAAMGMGANNTMDRIAASVGELEAVSPQFQPALDVPNGGVLFALPALLATGLLKFTERYFQLPKGYYGLASLFVLLAFLALARVKTIERVRYCAPGEWGKLLGLDRIPEVRTLRKKIQYLSQDKQAEQWSAQLCKEWMQAVPEQAATLYIDGHVRVYNGHQTKLPRHYVARQKLCLRATTDYWVNAMDGQPFFVIHQAVDPGLIKVIEQEILPRLKKELAKLLWKGELEDDPLLHRLSLVFDREGYSPDFFLRMKKQRVACVTYHKFPGKDWSEAEFKVTLVEMPSGAKVEMKLAERGTRLTNGLWVREIRKLTEQGHQTSILATDYRSNLTVIAVEMFSRWSQENFFKYMREHYGLDKLVDYSVEPISDPVRVVNPRYRQLDGQIRSTAAKLSRKLAKFGAMNLEDTIEPNCVEQFIKEKSALQDEIEDLQTDVEALKKQRKQLSRHIALEELPEDEKFNQLSTQSKHLIDTIKMIAYRAETVMANLLKEHMARPEEARSLLRSLYNTEADLLPDREQSTLTVQLHHMTTHAADTAIQKLCDELNETETCFPGTNLRLVMKVGS